MGHLPHPGLSLLVMGHLSQAGKLRLSRGRIPIKGKAYFNSGVVHFNWIKSYQIMSTTEESFYSVSEAIPNSTTTFDKF